MMMKIGCSIALAISISMTSLVYAASGQEVLAQVDEAMNRANDQVFDYEMVDIKDGKERKLRLEVSLKGEKRLISFSAPAGIKGTNVLVLSPTQMYVYLPAYRKVRRVASNVTGQGIMGTTYSNDYWALTLYAPKYAAKIQGETATEVTLELAAKEGTYAPYAKIVMRVEKARKVPVEMKYFDEKGQHVKTETRTAYTCEAAVCAPAEITMRDLTDGDHISKMVRNGWKVNSGLSDRLFTRRWLQQAR